MDIKRISTYDEFLKLEPVWNSLLARSDMDCPFMTFEWLKLWWESFGSGSEMLVLLLSENGSPAAIVPLMVTTMRRRGIKVRAVQFMANYFSLRSGMIMSPGSERAAGAALDWIMSSGIEYDLIWLDFIPGGSATQRGLDEHLASRGIRHRKMDGEAAPYIKLDPDWDTYTKRFSANFRSNVKRMNKAFDKAGPHENTRYSSEGSVGLAMQELLEISKNTWKFKDGTAIANDVKKVEFYTNLARLAASLKWLDIWILKLNGAPVAFIYALKYKGTVYGVKTSYHEGYRHLSAGHYILLDTIKRFIEEGFAEYDMMGNDEGYKLRFTPEVKPHYRYAVFGGTLKGKALEFIECRLIPLVKRRG